MEDNKPLIIGAVVLIALFLAFPMLGQLKAKSASPAAASSPGATAPAPVPSGPPLTAGELAGSVWKAETSRGPVTVELRADGSFVATPDSAFTAQMLQSMTGLSQIVGNWVMSGTTVTLSAQVGPQAVTFNGQVQGQSITIDGKAATRIR